MSLLDDLKVARSRKPSLSEWLISREPAERAAFEAAVDDLTVNSEALAVIVRKHGGATTRGSIEALRDARVTR